MMFEKDFQNMLISDNDLKSIVGNRIYPFIAEQGTKKPFIRWHTIAERKAINLLNGIYPVNKTELQVDIFASNIETARRIKNCIDNIIEHQTVFIDARLEEITPLAEDAETVHFPEKIIIFYKTI